MSEATLQRVFRLILVERDRQERLKAQGKFLYTCADKELGHSDCAIVLGEEVGEVCRAVLNVKGLAKDTGYDGDSKLHHLRAELVQVAAVACAWLESFECEPVEGIQL